VIGDGVQPYERDNAVSHAREAGDFASVLGVAIPAHDNEVIALVVDTVGVELRELIEHVPDRRDTTVSGGEKERNLARGALKEAVLTLRRIGIDAADGNYGDAVAEYKYYNNLMRTNILLVLRFADRWSLFNPGVHDAHYAALRQILQAKKDAQR